jgi:hypothetical protein
MKFTIKRIDRKEVETKFGRKWNVTATTETGERVSSFANKYTEAWKEGMTVDVEVRQNGKFINCVWPREDYQPRPGSIVETNRVSFADTRIDEILKLVKDIHADLWEAKPKKEMDLPADHTSEDVPFDPEERQPEEF